jgi:hypothetical protein
MHTKKKAAERDSDPGEPLGQLSQSQAILYYPLGFAEASALADESKSVPSTVCFWKPAWDRPNRLRFGLRPWLLLVGFERAFNWVLSWNTRCRESRLSQLGVVDARLCAVPCLHPALPSPSQIRQICELGASFYIPGSFIPAILRAKLGLPICLNIFFICAYWRSRLLTSCTVVPEPREMRLRRLPLITSW